MNSQHLIKKLMSILLIALSLSAVITSVAFADSGTPPQSGQENYPPVVIRQGDPVVHSETVVRDNPTLGTLSITVIYRAGWTDAYWIWTYPLNQTHYGSHNSQSDLVEGNIWADGSLVVGGSYVDSCTNHSSGQYASCETSELFHLPYSITATSWHYFHKSGYVDQNFSTSKTVNP